MAYCVGSRRLRIDGDCPDRVVLFPVSDHLREEKIVDRPRFEHLNGRCICDSTDLALHNPPRREELGRPDVQGDLLQKACTIGLISIRVS